MQDSGNCVYMPTCPGHNIPGEEPSLNRMCFVSHEGQQAADKSGLVHMVWKKPSSLDQRLAAIVRILNRGQRKDNFKFREILKLFITSFASNHMQKFFFILLLEGLKQKERTAKQNRGIHLKLSWLAFPSGLDSLTKQQ